MRKLAQDLLPVEAFSAEIAEGIVGYLDDLKPGYWYHRDKINSRPTKGDPTASYFFLGDRQQPKELRDYLFDLAPTIDGAKPDEACINRYEVGYGMPEHIDQALYRFNMVIALCDHGDGLVVDGKLYVDSPGKGLILPCVSPPHEVPPVQHKRYTLIYLYE